MKFVSTVLCTLLLGCFVPFGADAAGLSGSINVHQTSDTAAKAKNKAMNDAVRQVLTNVVSKYADSNAFNDLINNAKDEDLINFVTSSSVANEQISATAYSAKITMNLDNDAIKNWLTQNGVQNWIPVVESGEQFMVSVVVPNGLVDWAEIKRIAREDGIEIPGPKQPEFDTNETHIIADDGTAILNVLAHKNPEEKNHDNAVVDLVYNWNTKNGDTIEPIPTETDIIEEPDMTVGIIPGTNLFADDPERKEKAIHNAECIDLIQRGNSIYLYKKPNVEYELYVSTNEYQAERYPDGAAWIALDINTQQTESVNELYWNGSSMAPDDEAGQSESVGLD